MASSVFTCKHPGMHGGPAGRSSPRLGPPLTDLRQMASTVLVVLYCEYCDSDDNTLGEYSDADVEEKIS